MKIKPITVLAVIALAVAGVMYVADSSSKKATVATTQQPVRPSPTPEATPNRELKPNEKFIGPAGLYITVPEGMNFREEDAVNDPGMPRTASFYIEKTNAEEISYQLYGLYNISNGSSADTLEKSQKDLDSSTIKEITVGGYRGIEGKVSGPKGRYMTVIVKDNKIHSFSTYPPTPENKEITEQILSTISFR